MEMRTIQFKHGLTEEMVRMLRRYMWLFLTIFGCGIVIFYVFPPCRKSATNLVEVKVSEDRTYGRDEPLIFIGGMPRSGTTLARVMLDAHPDVRCGEETRVVPRILQMRGHWKKSPKESTRLIEAGVTDFVLDEAISSFVLNVIVKHGEPAKRLCNKDPFTLKTAAYLSTLFPKSKFIWMIRDGRAVVHSIISRKVTITGFDLTSYRQCLGKWNTAVETMQKQCEELGSEKCLPVHYEQLVLKPRENAERILKFLDVEWHENVLRHDQLINQPGGISLSKVERSSDQVVKPININALNTWVGHIPNDVVEDMDTIAPMLRKLGYDPNANPPNYGTPDDFVADNTLKILKNKEMYEDKAEKIRKLSKSNEIERIKDKKR